MDLTEKRNGTVVVLGASGRIDHQTADAFRQALEPYLENCSADGDRLAIDMSKVDYVSSVGLRALLLASKKAGAQKGKIAVAAMPPSVSEVFRIVIAQVVGKKVLRCHRGYESRYGWRNTSVTV